MGTCARFYRLSECTVTAGLNESEKQVELGKTDKRLKAQIVAKASLTKNYLKIITINQEVRAEVRTDFTNYRFFCLKLNLYLQHKCVWACTRFYSLVFPNLVLKQCQNVFFCRNPLCSSVCCQESLSSRSSVVSTFELVSHSQRSSQSHELVLLNHYRGQDSEIWM